MEIERRVYWGGVDQSVRKELWQFLLGHHQWNDDVKTIELKDRNAKLLF